MIRANMSKAFCLFVGLTICATHANAAELQPPRLQRLIQLRKLPSERIPVVSALAIQPSGNVLATAGDDHLVRLWDFRTGELIRRLSGHEDWVTAVAFPRTDPN